MKVLRELLQDPVDPLPARPTRLDVAVFGVALVTVAAETFARDAWPGRAGEVLLAVVVALVLPFRRTHPFGAFAVAFGTIIASQWIRFALSQRTEGLGSAAFVLLLPYTLGRYAQGRRVVAGFAVLLAVYGGSAVTGELRSSGDAVGALVVMLFPLAVGLALRALDGGHRRDVTNAQLLERQLLARELHDTVAHRVTAITLQAQAAKAVFDRKPEAARGALDAIESEATRALAELRSLVGTLRGDEVPLRPDGGLEGLDALVAEAGPHVHLEKSGEIPTLVPAVEHALLRIVRESLHNVSKHGRGVSRVVVRVESRPDVIHVRVTDDGEPVTSVDRRGFGLVGMRERANLVGGSLEAGPLPARGFQVTAVLPREPKEGSGS